MSERPEMITVSYVPGGTAEVHVSLPGSASNSARSSGPSAADVIFASSKLGPADPLFFYAGGLFIMEGLVNYRPRFSEEWRVAWLSIESKVNSRCLSFVGSSQLGFTSPPNSSG